jgi:ATP diphosphatase
MVMSDAAISKIEQIMKDLRDPTKGCPWDLKQTYQSIIPFTIEEVYEVVEAIEQKDFESLKDELGDLFFQVVFYSQLAREDGYFDLNDVINNLSDKLIRRHPHVFSSTSYDSENEVNSAWERQKQLERENKTTKSRASLLDDIPKPLPELKRAQKIQNRVAKQGFDWESVEQVWDKIEEESIEVKEAVIQADKESIEDELGDLLFSVVNLSRHLGVDADIALRKANGKFEKRFRELERKALLPISQYTLQQLERFWQESKQSVG